MFRIQLISRLITDFLWLFRMKEFRCRSAPSTARNPPPKPRPRAVGRLTICCKRCIRGLMRMLRRAAAFRCSKVGRLGPFVAATFGLNLCARPTASPYHQVPLDHVMRPTVLVPIADRRMERHGVAVKRHSPVRRREGGHNALAATAAARVHCSRVFHREVQHPRLQLARHISDKPVFEGLVPHHDWSPLSSMLPSVV